MLTGIVKLAQIDDYISPSQNCVQPKIMKPDIAKQTATVTLNDCLACSGCITSAESVLIEQMSINKFIQITNNSSNKIALMIAPQVLLSLSRYYNLSPIQCFAQMNKFFMDNFKTVVGLFQMSKAIQICHELIIEQLMERIQNKSTPVLCSECPGWVCYSEKTLTQKITGLMSHVKSPQQIMSHLLKQRYGKQCKVISIMPCYDKKLEAIRFDLTEKVKEVDLTIATIQFVELVKKVGTNGSRLMSNEKQQKKQIKTEQIKTNQKISQHQDIPTSQSTPNPKQQQHSLGQQQQSQQIKFIKDQTSNGYIEFILDRLGIIDYKCEQIKNSDYKEYSFEWKGNQYKMAKCYGFKNIQKIVQLIKKDKCVYLYVQIMACPGGCFGGGGQVRYEGVKNKDVIAGFDAMMEKYEIVGGVRPKINIKNEEIELQKLYFKYKPIEKTLTQAVLNW